MLCAICKHWEPIPQWGVRGGHDYSGPLWGLCPHLGTETNLHGLFCPSLGDIASGKTVEISLCPFFGGEKGVFNAGGKMRLLR